MTAEPAHAESRIEQVTLYARGARVRRAATHTVGEGASRLRLTGLPVALLDDSVRVEASGGALVTAVHVGLDAAEAGEAAVETSPALRAAQERLALAEAERARIDAALGALTAAPVALSPDDDEAPAAWDAMVAARRALIAVRAEREQRLREQAADNRRALDQARRALVAAHDRERRAGSAHEPKLHEVRKHVVLELDVRTAGELTVHLEYQVTAARWAPSYVARIDGAQVTFELRAMIAQYTGEDWLGVALRLSTAEPERFAALPELAAQRIGRRQGEPRRAGFRAAPEGAGALFLDYLQAFPRPPRPPAEPSFGYQMVMDSARPDDEDGAFSDEPTSIGGPSLDEVEVAKKRARSDGAGGAAPPAQRVTSAPYSQATAHFASVPPPAGAPRKVAARMMMAAPAGPAALYTTGMAAPAAPPPVPGPPPPRLDYANLRMAAPDSPQRGSLIAAAHEPRAAGLAAQLAAHARQLAALALPAGFTSDWPHTYDYAYAADGAVDVRSDAAWHSVAVTARPGTLTVRHVAVPREQADVFRLAVIGNPLAGPLLPGPIDVYDRGNFLLTSTVEQTPPGASVEIGLGVDAKVKLARNTEFREEAAGVLRGALRLHHAIKIDVDNLSDREIDLEVRERIPVTRDDDDDIEVVAGKVEPAWERWTPDAQSPRERHLRGGFRWRLALPAGQKRTLRAAYEVRIAGKHELVGGNRREA